MPSKDHNQLRILGIDEEDLADKFITCIRENLGEEVTSEDVEIIHRVGAKKAVNSREDQATTGQERSQARPRPIIVRLLSSKTKTCLLQKRQLLKGKFKVVIVEDMAPDLAKILKKLKEKQTVDLASFQQWQNQVQIER